MDLLDTRKVVIIKSRKDVFSMAKGAKFTNEYRQEIVRLVTELGKKPTEVAQDIGVTPTTVRNWVKKFTVHGDEAFPGKGNLRSADAEKRRLEKENRDLKEENAILKKAMGIFTRDVR